MISFAPGAAAADSLRIATWHTELERNGPGLLLRDILKGNDPQVLAVAQIVAEATPDVLLLQGVDYDAEGLALVALRNVIAEAGVSYPHSFALRPNTGLATGHDLDRDGRLDEPEDAHGYGRFAGQGGMAILSRYPIDEKGVRDLSDVLWRDVPGALLTDQAGQPLHSDKTFEVLRLASVAQWVVPLKTPSGPVTLLALHAGPPVFDGPEDRNGRRNHDQLMFWHHFLNGMFGSPPMQEFVLIGDTNQDPVDGEGRKTAIRTLLGDPRLQDPMPKRPGGALEQEDLYDTVAWAGPVPGPMRVSYVLPSTDWTVIGSGVHWPNDAQAAALADAASRHRLVWVDLTR